jgi:hypothetical protein
LSKRLKDRQWRFSQAKGTLQIRRSSPGRPLKPANGQGHHRIVQGKWAGQRASQEEPVVAALPSTSRHAAPVVAEQEGILTALHQPSAQGAAQASSLQFSAAARSSTPSPEATAGGG